MSEQKDTPTKLLTPKTIAEELGGATQEGESWLAFCPSHEDTTTPSLVISKGSKAGNGLMVHCRAGCKSRDVIRALDERSLWPAKQRKKRKEKQAEYDYYLADGTYAFTKARFLKSDGDKTFEIGRHDKDAPNGWKSGLPKLTHKLLYKLPELIDCDPERVIFIVEGEKDVDNLGELGCQATCNHDGAGVGRMTSTTGLRGWMWWCCQTMIVLAGIMPRRWLRVLAELLTVYGYWPSQISLRRGM